MASIERHIGKTKDSYGDEKILQLTKAKFALGDEHIEKFGNDFEERLEQPIFYNFRYVFFPSLINFIDHEFNSSIDFSSATFSEGAYFSLAKFNKYTDFSSAQFLKGANFSSANFIDGVSFTSATFSTDCNFSDTNFSNTAYFCSVLFERGVLFSLAKFHSDVRFDEAKFLGYTSFVSCVFEKGTSFRRAYFASDSNFNLTSFLLDVDFFQTEFYKDIEFISSKFLETSKVEFYQTKFNENVDFQNALFAGYTIFTGDLGENILFGEIGKTKAVMNLQNVRIEKPERFSFYRVRLFPSWFVNVDSRKIIFTDIIWENVSNNYGNENLFAEIKSLENRGVEKPKQLFRIACRHLAENAENNNRYEEASNFRRMAMETEWFERKEKLKSKPENFLTFLRQLRDIPIYALYRFSSSYGERWGRAFAVLLAILTLFAIIYTQVNFYNYPKDKTISESIAECKTNPEKPECGNQGLAVSDAVLHSLTTATFQNVDYRKPSTVWGDLWVYA